MIPVLVLRDRDIAFKAAHFEWAHPNLFEDAPRLESFRRYVAERLAIDASTYSPPVEVDVMDVVVIEASADEIREAYEKHRHPATAPTDEVLPANLAAVIAYVPADPETEA